MPKFIYKANDLVISHCSCKDEPAMSTGQLDCPWCGCGWLISCSRCAKAFTFAEVRETSTSLEELGRREAERRRISVDDDEVQVWADAFRDEFDGVEVGTTLVYLDGSYWPLDATDIAFEGYFARHDLKTLPHREALSDAALLDRMLGDVDYWRSRELPDRE